MAGSEAEPASDAPGGATTTTLNRLSHETSPYLLQHARNPVDWYPWGSAALLAAREQRKPILLSIGYSACHWCHVMARESFEDAQTARVMNELFVNVKVDREERPDLDRIYQVAHQMLTQRAGGWPLTMFLSHEDQTPFFGGTYFPDRPRHGLPAFRELLQRVATYYRERSDEWRAQGAALREAFVELDGLAAAPELMLDDSPLHEARRALEAHFDSDHGGFGAAPKFPQPAMIERLLRTWRATADGASPDLHALYMAALTLVRMAEGGVYDQLGGGFFRYAVDRQWRLPHFEKMLCDNAALLAAYAQASLATGERLFARVAAETAAWIVREMQHAHGGYCSSLDAEAQGSEGSFYVWTAEEAQEALGRDEYAAFAARFGLDAPANFEGAYWHLYAYRSIEDVAQQAKLEPAAVEAQLESARARLLARRDARVRPGRDDKILTSWNAMAIRGMAQAARVLRREDLADSATRALEYLRAAHWRDGRLLATSREGRARLGAYLDDHALLADALLELAQVRWRSDEIAFARELLELMLRHFEDRARGGFHFTADDHETLFHRAKPYADDATPSGNSVAALALTRFGWLLGETRYLDAAERTLRAAWPSMARHPSSHASMLTALEEWLHPTQFVILRGAAPAIARWQRELGALYAPRRIVLGIPADATGLPEALAAKLPRGECVAYLCEGASCSAPIESPADLVRGFRLGLGGATARKSAGPPPVDGA